MYIHFDYYVHIYKWMGNILHTFNNHFRKCMKVWHFQLLCLYTYGLRMQRFVYLHFFGIYKIIAKNAENCQSLA